MTMRIACCLSLLMMNGLVSAAQRFVPGGYSCGTPATLGAWSKTAVVNWPKYHFDLCNSGYNSYESILSATNLGKLTLKWAFKTGDSIESAPAVVNGRIYFGSHDNSVYALNARTGELVWKYTTGNLVSGSPAVVNGVVYIGSDDTNFYALNADTGALIWKYPHGYSSPTVANGLVYIGCRNDEVCALNASTGAQAWAIHTGGEVAASPAVANGVVYVTSTSDNIFALNAGSGSLVWRLNLGGLYCYTSPAVGDAKVFAGSSGTSYGGGVEFAFDALHGEGGWSYDPTAFDVSDATVANGIVYFSAKNSLYYPLFALDASTGELLWNKPSEGGSSPVVANGVLYVEDSNHHLRAFDAKTGADLWTDPIGFRSDSSPIVVNGMLYIGGFDGTMYAFGLPEQ
jgi:outer membrane protein assembly factor BamB